MCLGTMIASSALRVPSDGSHPCAWGQSIGNSPGVMGARFTPMCLGTMHIGESDPEKPGSPPCAWGQSLRSPIAVPGPCGSPPCAWGQCLSFRRSIDVIRFTPMCLGTMMLLDHADKHGSVHPHVPGDNEQPFARLALGLRFTPMCLGTMRKAREPGKAFAVHPHVPGDNAASPRSRAFHAGSPPCAWGQ